MSETAYYEIASVSRTPAGMSVVFSCPEEEPLTLLLSADIWKKLGHQEGERITEEALDNIRGAEELCRAISRTVKILSGSDHSRVQLLRKLHHFGFEGEVAEKAADYAEAHDYINEERQALRAADYFVRHKYWGRKRIAAELLMRGYKKPAIVKAAESISEEAYMTSLHALMDRKFRMAETKEDREKLFGSLFRLGYSIPEIKEAVKELQNES